MRRVYITFGGHAYDETTERIVVKAPGLGADEVRVYDDRWLMQQPFYEHNHWLWEHHGDQRNLPRGFGWFAWKPFIILDALSKCQPGDVVLYTDADTYPIADFSMLYTECHKLGGAMLFAANGCRHRRWCKRDCFIVMGQDEEAYTNGEVPHAVARFMLFEKGPWRPYQFLCEWMTYCVNPLATTFDPSVLAPEYDGFHEHRTEQAILTLLAHKYKYKLHREACQFGDGIEDDRDLYPQLFFQDGRTQAKTLEGSRFANV